MPQQDNFFDCKSYKIGRKSDDGWIGKEFQYRLDCLRGLLERE